MGIPQQRRCALQRAAIAVFLALVFFAQLVTPVRAGTVGNIRGVVTDAQTGAPIANVKISAAAPSGFYTATTNGAGFYSMTGVQPDTYTISFQATGYQARSVAGISVFADQVATANITMSKELKTIGRTTARSSAGAFQPSQTTDTYTVNATQIQQIQGNEVNISESNLITSLPGASYDSFGYPVIRGGRENEEGFQFEGIPYTDAFTNQFINTLATPGLGLSSVQLTPGAGDATFGNTGTGVLNLIAKRGTYPGFATAQLAVGGPYYFHAANVEFGTAAANGRWSEYATFAGQNWGFKPGGTNAPPSAQIFEFNGTAGESDREFLNNFVYRFGRNNTQSIQFFTDIDDHHFTGGYGGNPYCFKTCDPYFDATAGGFYGSVFGSLPAGIEPQDLWNTMSLDPYQTTGLEYLATAHRSPYTYYQPNITYKLQWDDNINPSTYLSLRYYRTNAVTTFDFPYGGTSVFYPGFWLQQGGFTNGGTISLNKQLSSQHLLKVGADFSFLHPVYNQPSNVWGYLSTLFGGGDPLTQLGTYEAYDFLNPTDASCTDNFTSIGLPNYCGFLSSYFPNGTPRIPDNLEQSHSNRQDSSVYVDDTYTPNDKWKADVGLRMDGVNYKIPAPGIDPATCTFLFVPKSYTPPASGLVGPGNCGTADFSNITNDQLKPRILEPRIGLNYRFGANDSARASYGRSVLFPPLGQIDLFVNPGAYAAYNGVPSYDMLSNLFLGYAPGTLPINDPTNAAYVPCPVASGSGTVTVGCNQPLCGILGYQVPCQNYGEQLYWENQNTIEGVPFQPIKPETFNNYELSYEHLFPSGFLNNVSFRLTGWYRKGYNATASVATPRTGPNGQPLTNPSGGLVYNPPVATNNGKDFADGIEMYITRPATYGLSGSFSLTYINEFSNVIPLSGSEDFFPSIPPASLALGNLYRVGFISPLQTVLTLNYRTQSGWRINPRFYYNVGYPTSAGLITAAFINGQPFNIPNTNASIGSVAPNGTSQWVDPMNPGSLFNPNIAATRGTPESASPGGKLTHPNTDVDMTLEYELKNRDAVGINIFNVFDEKFSGASLNGFYQPVANGLSGPLSGINPSCYGPVTPIGCSNYLPLVHGQQAYVNVPNSTGRNYYVYFTIHP